jgi:tRNA modification GTPase
MVLTDTAGLRESSDEVESIGIARTEGLIESADVLVWLGDPEDAPEHARVIKVHAKADLAGRRETPTGSIAVSSVTGQGLQSLLEQMGQLAGTLLPTEGAIALNRRQAAHVAEAADALDRFPLSSELVLVAESLRQARNAFDRLTGRAGVEDVLDALFSRFCLGK